MSHPIVTASFVLVGLLHLLPGIGALGAARLGAIYQVSIDGSDLEILMRHRAILFALLGSFLIYAGFEPEVRVAGFVAGFASAGSFVLLCASVGAYNPALRKVLLADVAALVLLGIALGRYLLDRPGALA